METMVELEKARILIDRQIAGVAAEKIPLSRSFGRILAENIYSPLSLPPFCRSPLDGYAYKGEENSAGEPRYLKIVAEIPAGTWSERTIQSGEAAKIFTGAPLPPGANCVVRMEDTEEDGDTVVIKKPVEAGKNVVFRGEEIGKGELLLAGGKELNPPAVGLLASVGIEEVDVFCRPQVGIISTGSELAEVGAELAPGKIYNSNSYTLCGLVGKLGCVPHVLPAVRDNVADTLAALRKFKDMDAVITTGGASVGDYDLMLRVLAEFGCEMLFWKVNLKPGTPVIMGHKEGKLYFGLSGNPAAAMTTFELLIRPALLRYAGRADWEPREFPVRIKGDFAKRGEQRRFLRAKAIWKDGEIWADISRMQAAGVLRTLVDSHMLVDVPAKHGPVHDGEILNAVWISSWEG